MKLGMIVIFGALMVGCVPQEYKCPEGLAPSKYQRHTEHVQNAVGKLEAVHSSDLTCERFRVERH